MDDCDRVCFFAANYLGVDYCDRVGCFHSYSGVDGCDSIGCFHSNLGVNDCAGIKKDILTATNPWCIL